MAKSQRATGTAKDPDPKVEKAKQNIQKNADKLPDKGTKGENPAKAPPAPGK